MSKRNQLPPILQGEELQNHQRHHLLVPALLVGVLTGLVSVCFHLAVDEGELLRAKILTWAAQNQAIGLGPLFMLIVTAIAISAGLIGRFAPEAAGSGIPHLKAILLGKRQPFRWLRVLVVKFLSTLVGGTGGMVLGREGPSVHMGSAVGQGLANLWPKSAGFDKSILVAAGGGAGLAAAFNAPLSGLVFVLEELERRCASIEFFAAATACLSADVVCRAILGQHSTFYLPNTGIPPLNILIVFLPLGIVSALFGMLFTTALLRGQALVQSSQLHRFAGWLLLAMLITCTAQFAPVLLGGGQHFANDVLDGEQRPTLQSAALFFVIRFALTIGSTHSGAAGGIFMPILVLGALLGWGAGEATQALAPELHVDPRLFAVVGMAAYFSAIVQAPLTGIVLIIEMTQNYALILPLFIACFSASLVMGWVGIPPIYEAMMKADLERNGDN